MKAFLWTIILTTCLTVVSCRLKDHKEDLLHLGIWQGTYEGELFSIEFREDGRAILLAATGDDIGLAGYSIDLQQQPSHLDIEFRVKSWGIIKTLIEQIGPDTMRISHLRPGTGRPGELTSEAIVLRRAQTHVLPRGVTSAEQRDAKLQHALIMDMIWFEGSRHEDLVRICEVVFRHQFTHNASAVQQKAPAYFLSVDGKDPPVALLNAFGATVHL